jgi:hypothetical protein
MTIARAVGRRLLGLFADLAEDSNASLKVTLRNILDQLGAQVVGSIENFIEHGLRAALEMNRLAAPILRGTAALDPAIVLQAVEQARERRSFNPHALGDFLLGELVSALGKVNKGAPFTLAQTEGPQALIELRTPGARGAEKDKTELVNVWWRHVRQID